MCAAEHTAVVYFSLEMEPRHLFRRMVVQRARVDTTAEKRQLTTEERQSAQQAAT